MTSLVRIVWSAWGGLVPTSMACAIADGLSAAGLLTTTGALEVVVVDVILQLVRWRDAAERVGGGR